MDVLSQYEEPDVQKHFPTHISIGCLYRHISGAPVFVSSDLHVDVDGRGGAVYISGQGFYHTNQALHHSIHCCQLWSVDTTPLYV